MPDTREDLLRRIKVLSERLWEDHCTYPEVEAWLSNFDGQVAPEDEEQLEALYLLSHVNYYGVRELRVLLTSIFRDLYRYPIVQALRVANDNTRDGHLLEAKFEEHLKATRFLGMGNPAESGTHMLYYFRQENQLQKDLFVNQHQLFTGPASDPQTDFSHPDMRHIVFIDDLLGSGQQSHDYSRTLLRDIHAVATRHQRTIKISYYVLFARTAGLTYARKSLFDEVQAVHELDDTYLTFGSKSRVFLQTPPGIDAERSERMCRHYGEKLYPGHPLGYRDGQLLLGFHHNIPDNTLPIVWHDEPHASWEPILPRYPKVY